MEREYYGLKDQRIEFDNEKKTMTVVTYGDTFKTVTIHTMDENSYNGQLYMFKAQIFKSLAYQEQGIVPRPEDAPKMEHTPYATTEEDFKAVRTQAIDYIVANS